MNLALDEPSYYNNEGTSTFTLYDPYNWTRRGDGEKRNPIFALAHDLLGHGFFRDIGRVIFGKTNGIPNEEIQAVRAENIARKAYNKKVEPTKIRDTYHKAPLPNRMRNKTRTGDPESNQY